jgi:site-specific recombinase XerD
MSSENIEALWGYVEGNDDDIRSKAILALMLSTGMRSVDITKIELSNIDWNNDSISFIQSKTGESMNIKLFPAIGSALARYLTEQRPKGTGLKSIFLTKRAPYRQLTPSSCNRAIKYAFEKVGITYVPDGLHCPRAVRRSLVSRMIAKGVPVQKAAASIGHIDESSIDLYTELDVNRMRSICLPIPTPMKGWCE